MGSCSATIQGATGVLQRANFSEVTVDQVLSSLRRAKCVLLEGPPGTGKTRLLGELIARTRSSSGGASTGASVGNPLVDGRSRRQPFRASGPVDLDWLPKPVRVEWTTFHQSYSYEDFIVGRRPRAVAGGMELTPVFGLLMDIAVSIGTAYGSGVLIIDEVNRANASRVLGEFITYMDPDYRAEIEGKANPRALAARLPGIAYGLNNVSEAIRRLDSGESVNLSKVWSFPEHLYVVASMNSVDKAALPLDSALSRRFERIRMRPSVGVVAATLGVDLAAARSLAADPSARDDSAWTAEVTAVLLLDRINDYIERNLGEDYALGHSHLLPLRGARPEDRWPLLASLWDDVLYPQLAERFLGNSTFLRELLRAEEVAVEVGAEQSELAAPPIPAAAGRLSALPLAQAMQVLRALAR